MDNFTLFLGGKIKFCPNFLYFFIRFRWNLVQKVPTNIHWVIVSFTEISTVKTISDQGLYTNCYTRFPHSLSDLDDIWNKGYAQNAVQIWEFLQNQCMGSCNFPAGTNELIFTHSTIKWILRVNNATSHSATVVTLIFLK